MHIGFFMLKPVHFPKPHNRFGQSGPHSGHSGQGPRIRQIGIQPQLRRERGSFTFQVWSSLPFRSEDKP